MPSDSADRAAGTPLATADTLARRIRQLQSELRTQRKELDERLATDKREVTADLYGLIHQMQRLLFGESATAQPVLTLPVSALHDSRSVVTCARKASSIPGLGRPGQ